LCFFFLSFTLTHHHSTLTVPSTLQALAEVLQWFSQFKGQYPDEVFWLQCEIALVEIFTNAVRHAHRDYPEETPIEILVNLSSDCLRLEIWDQGQSFDLINHLQSLPNRISPDQEGGRGLKIIKEVSDQVSYTRHNDRNCFSMTRYLNHHV
jgi:serine/threonine-protein kinase RsbW